SAVFVSKPTPSRIIVCNSLQELVNLLIKTSVNTPVPYPSNVICFSSGQFEITSQRTASDMVCKLLILNSTSVGQSRVIVTKDCDFILLLETMLTPLKPFFP